MSARGSTAKILSLSSMSPPVLAEPESDRVCTLTFILAFLAFVSVGGRLGAVLGRAALFIFRSLSCIGGFGVRCVGRLRVGSSAGFLLGSDRSDFLVARQRRHLVDRRIVDQARLGNVDVACLH